MLKLWKMLLMYLFIHADDPAGEGDEGGDDGDDAGLNDSDGDEGQDGDEGEGEDDGDEGQVTRNWKQVLRMHRSQYPVPSAPSSRLGNVPRMRSARRSA